MTDAFEAIAVCSKCRRPSVLDPNGRIYYREGRVWCYPVCPPARKTEVKVEICSSTIDAGKPGCTAWTKGDPWPWHGCRHPERHNQTGGRGERTTHECKCGERWGSRR